MKLNKIKKCISPIVLLSCFLFIFLSIKKLNLNINDLIGKLNITLFIVTTLFFIFDRHINAVLWNWLLRIIAKQKIDYKLTINIYLRSNIGKYLPGNVMHFAGRNIIGKQYGLSHTDMLTATILEIVTLVLGTSFILLFADVVNTVNLIFDIVKQSYVVLFAALVIAVVIVTLLLVKKRELVSSISKKILTRQSLFLLIIITMIRAFICYCAGITFATMLSVGNIKIVAKGYCLSWLLGFIVPGAPGGLGIRETALILLLSAVPQDMLLVTMVWHRLATIIADIISFGCSYIWKKRGQA